MNRKSERTHKLPDFLIIGSMKSGTTGIFQDLATHPDIYSGGNKEPQNLTSDKVLTDNGIKNYSQEFKAAKPQQLICDASTAYAKRPDFERVSFRASKVLSNDFKVIYIVRQPVDRIVSQYHHEFVNGDIDIGLMRLCLKKLGL